MPVDVADWILAVLESTHPIIFCCWPAEIPGFVFYRALTADPSASRQALEGSTPTQRLSASAWRVSALGGSRHRPSASWQALGESRHRPSASRQALGDPNWPIREARQQLFCSANVGAIYYPRLTTARLANAGRASA